MTQYARLRPDAVKRIAVFRALYLGDLILSVPALRSLRTAFPRAEITFIGLPWARELMRRYGYVDRFLDFPGFPGLPEVEPDDGRARAFLAEARAHRYDLAIQMHGDGSISNGFVAALGAARAIGFSLDPADRRLTDSLPYVEAEHETSKCLRLVRLAGAPGDDAALEFPLSAVDDGEAAMLLLAHRLRLTDRLVGLHVGAKHPARRWPPVRWARLADKLAALAGARIALTGGESERDMVAAVADEARVPVANLAGQTSLGGLAALIARMTLFVGGDSGPAHLAHALGAPSVTIFGPTDPRRWGPVAEGQALGAPVQGTKAGQQTPDIDGASLTPVPWPLSPDPRHLVVQGQAPCAPCGHHVCPIDHRCLTSVTSSDVLAEALQIISYSLNDSPSARAS